MINQPYNPSNYTLEDSYTNDNDNESQQGGELNLNMQTQIVSMLKEVINDEQTVDEINEKIFSTDEEEDDDSNQTQGNFYIRPIKNKPKTTQQFNPYFTKQGPFINENQLRRSDIKKFPTTQFQPVFPQPQYQPQSQPQPQPYPNYIRNTPYQHLRYTNVTPHPNAYSYVYPNVFLPQPQKKFNTMIVQNSMQLYQSETYLTQLEMNLFQKKKIDPAIYQEISGKIGNIIQLQKGAKILLTYIENTSKEVLNVIYEELKPKLTMLLLNQYANRFCMKLFFELNPQERLEYLQMISSTIVMLAVNKISTYPLQCFVENVHSQMEKEIIWKAFRPCYMQLAIDTYGTHVLEKMILFFDYSLIKDLSGFIANNFFFLATNSNGLCIVKKIIVSEYQRDYFPKIKEELVKNSIPLIQDPFGNYALQIALDNWEINDVLEIINSFKGKGIMLSNQKFSSNVIEKCFEKSAEYLSLFINEICEDSKAFLKIMKNNYGNYVLQTALKSACSKDQKHLIDSIELALEQIVEKKRVNKWKRIILGYKDIPSI